MRFEQRVIFNTTDISETVNDFRSGTASFAYTAGQYVYIGSLVPFNNLFFEVGSANDVASALSVDVWWGDTWAPVVDLHDGTNGLFNSGRIVWSTEIDQGWDDERESEDIPGLSGTKIYNMYWARFSWSATMNVATTIKYIGQKFADDDILASYYPDLTLAAIKEQFETGKTTWDEQHYMAAQIIVNDLKKRNIIVGRGQILDYSDFEQAACHKLAETVYRAFGPSYFDQLAIAAKDYEKHLNLPFAKVDKLLNARLEPVERVFSTRFMTR